MTGLRNIVIELESYELMIGHFVGGMRRVRSINDGLNKNKHAHKSDFETDADGACSEIAAARYFNVYWSGRVTRKSDGDYKALDIAGYQIRSTVYVSGHLIIRPNDADGEQYILVISRPPRFRLVGTFNSTDAKRDEFKYTDDQGYEHWRVPQEQLFDLPRGAVAEARAA